MKKLACRWSNFLHCLVAPASVPAVMPGQRPADGFAAARRPGAQRVRAGPLRLHLQRPTGGEDRLHQGEGRRLHRPVASLRGSGGAPPPPRRAPAVGGREGPDIPVLHPRLPLVRGPGYRAQSQVRRRRRHPAIGGMHSHQHWPSFCSYCLLDAHVHVDES